MGRYAIGLCSSAIFAGLAIPLSVAAQEADNRGTTNTGGSRASVEDRAAQGAGQDIVVTAQLRTQRAQDVPISMTVIGADQIKQSGAQRLEEMARYIPNLNIQPTPVANQVYIRGIGSGAQNFAFEQAVSLYVDGIYAGRNRQFMAPFFDIERIEVLRGPQGALLGKNTSAGAISIVTGQPTATFQGRADIATEFSRPGIDLTGYVSGPLSDTLRARLAVKFTDEDGYVHNRFSDRDEPHNRNFMIRGALKFLPVEGVDMNLKLEYDDFRVRGTPVISIFPGNDDFERAEKNAQTPPGKPQQSHTQAWNGAFSTNARLGDNTITAITGYSWFKADQFGGAGADVPELYYSSQGERFHQLSQEIRLTSPTGQLLEYIAGIYLDTARYKTYFGADYNIGITGSAVQLFDQKSNNISLFGQAVLNISRMIKIQGSLRYTRAKKSADYEAIALSGIPLYAPGTLSGERRESNLDPSVTVQIRPAADVMLYATFAKGSKGGGFTSNSRATPDTFQFAGERSTNYEIGVKASFLERKATVDLAVFDTTFKDLQVGNYNPQVAAVIIGNAGRARTRGVEFTGTLRPTNGLDLSTSLAYLDAIYTDFPGGPCQYPNLTCDLANNNIAGTTIPGASKWKGGFNIRYDFPISDRLKLGLSSGVMYRSAYYAEPENTPESRQAGYAKVDGRIELSTIDDRWTIALFGRNLTDAHTFNFSYFWPFAAPTSAPHRLKFLEETRVIGISATAKF